MVTGAILYSYVCVRERKSVSIYAVKCPDSSSFMTYSISGWDPFGNLPKVDS